MSEASNPLDRLNADQREQAWDTVHVAAIARLARLDRHHLLAWLLVRYLKHLRKGS